MVTGLEWTAEQGSVVRLSLLTLTLSLPSALYDLHLSIVSPSVGNRNTKRYS